MSNDYKQITYGISDFKQVQKEGLYKAYHALTHGTGFYRDIFKLFKPMFDLLQPKMST